MESLQKHETEVVIITGMSGAGKTVAIQSFEDLGYYCIDNLPPELLSTFIKLMIDSNKQPRNIAVVMDLRGGEMFNSLADSVNQLEEATTVTPKLLFLDAGDEVLVRRYKETRRSHPLANSGLPLEGIKKERQMLSDLKGRAQYIYNTSKMKPRELREKIQEEFSSKSSQVFTINVMSFGFKHGIPIDADLVFDVRFLPNPYYIEELRLKSGLNEEVSSYVLKWVDTKTLIEKLTDLFLFMIPQYKREGKTQLVIAFGCTGGQHRSVTLAEYFGKLLKEDDKTIITHRDVVIRKE
ncbi:RNase adapter RapZ [Psychrobacillus sp. NPDC096623]|uniref:RNase adapter RapZ n=1 Tax=Psychrobacillus sp. NPDC096623 TaxID=3364492 RepID=UPI0038182D16